jgi:hypothetical protein
MTLIDLHLSCTKTLTQPKKPGKQPREVWVVSGQIQGFEALFRDLDGQKYRGQWSFWSDPTQGIIERSNEKMSFSELQKYGAERKLAKADRYRKYADNAEHRSESAYNRVRSICDRIPFGQPILIGHHSEKNARADQRRIDRGMGKCVEESKKADYFREQSSALKRDAGRAHSLRYIGNRIKEKTAEVAKLKRYLNGQYYAYSKPGSMPVSDEYRIKLEGLLKSAKEALAHWQEETKAWGEQLPSRETIQIGMQVRTIFGWAKVIRVNPKSVTVQDQWPSGTLFTRTIQYHKIAAFRKHGNEQSVSQEAV